MLRIDWGEFLATWVPVILPILVLGALIFYVLWW
jgi:hypothetical protein